MSKGLYINDKLVATIGLSGKVVTSIYDVDAGKEIWSKGGEPEQPNNEIWYTSSDGKIVTPNDSTVFGANILKNTYKDGKGVITFDGDVTSIGESAFFNNTKLLTLSLPNSVTIIKGSSIRGCTSLISCNIPNSVTTIESYAFVADISLTEIIIPNSVTKIGNYAFGNNPMLQSIAVDSGNTVYDSRNNCNAIIKTSTNELILGCKNTVIPDSVTTIGQNAFSGCTGLTSITSLRTTAPTVQSSTFGNSTSNYTGRNTYNTGTNVLKVPSGATGYNTSYWSSVLLDSTKCGFHIEYIEYPSTDKTITFTPDEYTESARYSIDGGDEVYVDGGTTATIVLPSTATTISFNCQKGSSGGWAINGVEKSTARPWTVNVADLNNGDVITCDISS